MIKTSLRTEIMKMQIVIYVVSALYLHEKTLNQNSLFVKEHLFYPFIRFRFAVVLDR